ncbi:hypothetical protein K502DRAFT_37820 [Neoconidiobolus thromboides FSU 785]|nr:hypothetical protein K502DRAFT_37820 [Neoconidiobolus thromboides FSU 785]
MNFLIVLLCFNLNLLGEVYSQKDPFSQTGCIPKYSGSLNKEQQKQNLRCYTPTVTGKCFAYFKSYHYDPKSNQCISGVYGGCDDGCQAFNTVEECNSACTSKPKDDIIDPFDGFSQLKCTVTADRLGQDKYKHLPITCFVQSKMGTCRMSIPSFHFDPVTNSCVSTTFGGCSDGCRAFESMLDCQNACLPS